MLLRYRWKKDDEKKGSFKIYFNEIRVKDKKITKLFKNSFLDIEAYFFDKNAEDYLQINRDKFLYEKRSHIIDLICNTNMNCLYFLVDRSGKTRNHAQQDYKRAIWAGETCNKQGSIQDYFEFLLKKESMKNYVAGVQWFVQDGDRIRRTEGFAEAFFPVRYDEIWLIDVREKYTQEIHLRKHFEMDERCIIEDIFPCCMKLAVSKFTCMREASGDYVVLYKVERRSGQPVTAVNNSFWAYLDKRYQELQMKEQKLGRIMLPGMKEYRELCVSRLSGDMGTLFEKKLNSAIIMPIIAGELTRLLEKREKQEAEQLIDGEFLKEDKDSYEAIVKYIQEYGVVRDLKKEDIKNAYRRLLLDVWKNLPKR